MSEHGTNTSGADILIQFQAFRLTCHRQLKLNDCRDVLPSRRTELRYAWHECSNMLAVPQTQPAVRSKPFPTPDHGSPGTLVLKFPATHPLKKIRRPTSVQAK